MNLAKTNKTCKTGETVILWKHMLELEVDSIPYAPLLSSYIWRYEDPGEIK